ncbi:tetraspanin-33-like [Haemaphysalis longicornis]
MQQRLLRQLSSRRADESTLIIDVSPLQRVPLVFINLVIFTFCCAVAVYCGASIVDRRDEISFRDRSLLMSFVVNLDISILIVSLILLVISFVGFIGSLRENLCMLRCYLRGIGVLLIVDLLFMAGCVGLTYLSKSSAQSLFSIDLIVSYRDNLDFARLVDLGQTSFQCCGVTEGKYRDWNSNIYFNCSQSNPSSERCSVPPSCCKPPEDSITNTETRLKRQFCGRGVLRMTEQQAWHKIYTRNCVDAAVAYVRSNVIVMVVAGIIAFAVLALFRMMAQNVLTEIISLTAVYDKYYRNLARGQSKSLARQSAMREMAAARGRQLQRQPQKRARR